MFAIKAEVDDPRAWPFSFLARDAIFQASDKIVGLSADAAAVLRGLF